VTSEWPHKHYNKQCLVWLCELYTCLMLCRNVQYGSKALCCLVYSVQLVSYMLKIIFVCMLCKYILRTLLRFVVTDSKLDTVCRQFQKCHRSVIQLVILHRAVIIQIREDDLYHQSLLIKEITYGSIVSE
jgi:hypothetical protein